MEKQFFILIGRSGSGKGTQAELLDKYLAGQGAQNIIHITTGGSFREFIEGGSFTSKHAKEIANQGGLLPEFLAVWNWSNIFINKFDGAQTVLLDGAPRKMAEVNALHSALKFYGYVKPVVVYIDVTSSWALERLLGRDRIDDRDPEAAKKKMDWFEEDVLPVIDNYSRDPRYTYIHVNGEQPIEEVHKEIVSKLENSSHNR